MKEHWSISKGKLTSLEEGLGENVEDCSVKSAGISKTRKHLIQCLKVIFYIELAFFLGWSGYWMWQNFKFQSDEMKVTDVINELTSKQLYGQEGFEKRLGSALERQSFDNEENKKDNLEISDSEEIHITSSSTPYFDLEINNARDSTLTANSVTESTFQQFESSSMFTPEIEDSTEESVVSSESDEYSPEIPEKKTDVMVWNFPFQWSIHGIEGEKVADIENYHDKEASKDSESDERITETYESTTSGGDDLTKLETIFHEEKESFLSLLLGEISRLQDKSVEDRSESRSVNDDLKHTTQDSDTSSLDYVLPGNWQYDQTNDYDPAKLPSLQPMENDKFESYPHWGEQFASTDHLGEDYPALIEDGLARNLKLPSETQETTDISKNVRCTEKLLLGIIRIDCTPQTRLTMITKFSNEQQNSEEESTFNQKPRFSVMNIYQDDPDESKDSKSEDKTLVYDERTYDMNESINGDSNEQKYLELQNSNDHQITTSESADQLASKEGIESMNAEMTRVQNYGFMQSPDLSNYQSSLAGETKETEEAFEAKYLAAADGEVYPMNIDDIKRSYVAYIFSAYLRVYSGYLNELNDEERASVVKKAYEELSKFMIYEEDHDVEPSYKRLFLNNLRNILADSYRGSVNDDSYDKGNADEAAGDRNIMLEEES